VRCPWVLFILQHSGSRGSIQQRADREACCGCPAAIGGLPDKVSLVADCKFAMMTNKACKDKSPVEP
jgi:hypothetical protein